MSMDYSGDYISFPDGTKQASAAVGMKNRLINSGMVIDQRNAGASVTATTSAPYSVDRWFVYSSPTSKFTAQQNAGSVTPPVGFANYLGMTSSSAYTVSGIDIMAICQRIEGNNLADLAWGTANAKTVTLSAWVYSSLTGTFGGSIQNSASDRSYPFTYTISSANTWTQISVTVAGDNTGTWSATTGTGMQIWFTFGVGSTRSGTANTWAGANYVAPTGATSVVGTNGATFYITGVQLEVGSSATSFDYRPYGTELALCQRYYYNHVKGTTLYVGMGDFYVSSQADVGINFPVTMRTTPTLDATYGTNYYYLYGGATNGTVTNSWSILWASNSGSFIYVTPDYSGTAGNAIRARTNNASSSISFSAEL